MPTETPAQVEPNSSAPAAVANGGLVHVAPKCGIRTTQLWLIVGVIALLAAALFADKLSANVFALIAPAMAIIYCLVRETIYRDAAAHPTDALDKILGTILSAIPEPDSHAVPAIIAALKGVSVSAPVAELPATAAVAPAPPALSPSPQMSSAASASSSSTLGSAAVEVLALLTLIFVAVASLLLTGCAETAVKSRTGKVLMKTHANADSLAYAYDGGGEHITLQVVKLNHSDATLAGGQSFKLGADSVGTAVVSGILSGGLPWNKATAAGLQAIPQIAAPVVLQSKH